MSDDSLNAFDCGAFVITGVLVFGGAIMLGINGVRSFIPSNSEQLYYLLGSSALVVGGCWAYLTWRHNEIIRRHREIPAIEMSIQFKDQELPNGKVVVEINAVTRNSGVIPIPVDLRKLWLRIDERALPNQEQLLPRLEGRPIVNQRIGRADVQELTLEPMTNTTITEYFVATKGVLYGFTISVSYLGTDWIWDRTQLHLVGPARVDGVNVRNPNAGTGPN